ncbi:MAG: flagellar protein FlaG [Candidatus Sericytochromatia bacterium]
MADISRMAVSASGEDSIRQQLLPTLSLPGTAPEAQTAVAVKETEAPPEEEQEYPLSDEEKKNLQDTIDNLDNLIKPLSIGLNVQRLESIDRWYVQLLDRETGEVLREIPPRKILQMQENVRAMQGLLFDKFS